MKRLALARMLALFMALFGLALVWNALWAGGYPRDVAGYGIIALQLLAAPFALLAAWRLWRRERRGVVLSAMALLLGAASGGLAAWAYAPAAERLSATLGALAAGVVLAAGIVVLGRVAMAPLARSEDTPGSALSRQ